MVAINESETLELKKKHKDVDPYLIEKWQHIFTTFFDRNCSKQVDWGDFYLVVRRIRDVYGADSVQYTYARKSLEALWQGLCKLADSDKDELVSMEEWIDLLKKVDLSKRPVPGWFNDYQDFMFKLFDVSADNFVDISEYADGMGIYGYSYNDSMEAYKTFAIDEKGNRIAKISPEHWKQLFLDLFFSPNRSLVGNNLFGKIEKS